MARKSVVSRWPPGVRGVSCRPTCPQATKELEDHRTGADTMEFATKSTNEAALRDFESSFVADVRDRTLAQMGRTMSGQMRDVTSKALYNLYYALGEQEAATLRKRYVRAGVEQHRHVVNDNPQFTGFDGDK